MSPPGLSRLPRLLALVPWLLRHPGASLADVGEAFGVDAAQIHADLRLLWVCGLPGYTPVDLLDFSFTADRVSVTAPLVLDRPLHLDAGEVMALLPALHALAGLPDLPENAGVGGALEALEALAGPLAGLAAHVQVTLPERPEALELVRAAMGSGRRLRIDYLVESRDEVTTREVDPWRLLAEGDAWYLQGYCHRAGAPRLFRVDRILDVQPGEQPAPEPPVAADDPEGGFFRPAPTDRLVHLALAPGAHWVAEYYPCEVLEDTGSEWHVSLRTPEPARLGWLVLGLAGQARVLGPADLVAAVHRDAEAALAAYAALSESWDPNGPPPPGVPTPRGD